MGVWGLLARRGHPPGDRRTDRAAIDQHGDRAETGERRHTAECGHTDVAPQAIGVQVAHPDRQVVALSGDGGLSMLLGELLTLRQQRLPVKIVVFDNGALSFVELGMKADGIVNFGTDPYPLPVGARVLVASGDPTSREVEPDEAVWLEI